MFINYLYITFISNYFLCVLQMNDYYSNQPTANFSCIAISHIKDASSKWKKTFFISYSTVPEPTLRHYRRNSLTQLMLISTALKPVFNLKVNKSLPGLLLNAYCDPYKQTMPFFNFFCFFFYSKHFKTEYCLLGFHLRIALDLLKCALFCSYHSCTLPFQNTPCILNELGS